MWQDEDGDWTWAYVEPDAELELRSNDSYPSRESARAAVELAYPNVEVWGPRPVEREAEEVDRKKEAWLLLLVLAALALLFWGLRNRRERPGD